MAKSPNPEKEIIRAAKSGKAEIVKELLEMDSSLISARDSDGSTPLHCACWKGHEAVVELLLKSGADVNAENDNEHWGTTRYTPQRTLTKRRSRSYLSLTALI